MNYKGLFVGLTTIDIQYFVPRFPGANEKIKTSEPDVLVGGPALNAAVAFSHLNGGADFVSSVGENPFSTFIKNDFESNNLRVVDVSAAQDKSPVIASVVTSGNGDRTIFTHNPLPLEVGFSAERLFKGVEPQILLCDGFYPEVSIACAQLAKERGIPVVLDCGSWKPQYEELLKLADVAICSADFYPPECENVADVFTALETYDVQSRAISRGRKSLLFQHGNGSGEVEIEKVEVVDTLGAGDFLHGAFCYYYIKKHDFYSAIKKATKLATATCKYKGTRKWQYFVK